MSPTPTPDECKQVWAAVLWQARNDLRDHRPNGTSKASHNSAVYWIRQRGGGVGSFEYVCEVLELPPAKVRETLMPAGGLQ